MTCPGLPSNAVTKPGRELACPDSYSSELSAGQCCFVCTRLTLYFSLNSSLIYQNHVYFINRTNCNDHIKRSSCCCVSASNHL